MRAHRHHPRGIMTPAHAHHTIILMRCCHLTVNIAHTNLIVAVTPPPPLLRVVTKWPSCVWVRDVSVDADGLACVVIVSPSALAPHPRRHH